MDFFTYKSTRQNTQMTSNRVKGNQSYYKRAAQQMLKQWEKTLRELRTNNFHREFSHLSFVSLLDYDDPVGKWHRRMGHLSVQSLRDLLKVSNGIDLTEQTIAGKIGYHLSCVRYHQSSKQNP